MGSGFHYEEIWLWSHSRCGSDSVSEKDKYRKHRRKKVSGFCEEYEAQIFSGSAGSWNAWVDAGFRT